MYEGLALWCDAAAAHPFEVTRVDARFLEQGVFRLDITFHVDAMLAGVPGDVSEEEYRRLRALPSKEIDRRLEMVRRYFVAMVTLRFDDRVVEPTVSFPARDLAKMGRPAGMSVDGS